MAAATLAAVSALLLTVGMSAPPSPAPAAQLATTPVRIVAAGDIACDPDLAAPRGNTCRHAATADLIKSLAPAAVLVLGDIQYEDGSATDFARAYDPTWGDFRFKTYPVPGNHEYHQPAAVDYFAYFGVRAHGPNGWYAFDLGEWRIYALNTECSKIDCSAERDWLARDLTANPKTCSLAFMHRPRFSSGKHGDDTVPGPFWRAMYAHDVDVVLAGHDHDYERFTTLRPDGTYSAAGIQSFVVGTGGKNLEGWGTVHPRSRFRYNSQHGVLQLDLGSGSYSWSFRTISGLTPDQGTKTCR